MNFRPTQKHLWFYRRLKRKHWADLQHTHMIITGRIKWQFNCDSQRVWSAALIRNACGDRCWSFIFSPFWLLSRPKHTLVLDRYWFEWVPRPKCDSINTRTRRTLRRRSWFIAVADTKSPQSPHSRRRWPRRWQIRSTTWSPFQMGPRSEDIYDYNRRSSHITHIWPYGCIPNTI